MCDNKILCVAAHVTRFPRNNKPIHQAVTMSLKAELLLSRSSCIKERGSHFWKEGFSSLSLLFGL